jgi:putative DNA primase/helicase
VTDERPLLDLAAILDGTQDLEYGHEDLVDAYHIEPQSPEWYWRQRIVKNDLNILAGTQGVGKSQIAMSIAAEATRRGEAVLIISAEDSAAHTTVPRLIAAGADRTEGKVMLWKQEAGFTLDEFEKFQLYIRRANASLVIVDPVAAFVTAKTDTYKDAHVRSLLAPLRAVAENEQCTILALMHLKKGNEAEAVNNVGGSIAWTAAPRSVLMVKRTRDVDEGDRRLLHHVKCNVGPEQPAIEFDIEQVEYGVYGPFATSAVVWGRERADIDLSAAFDDDHNDKRHDKPSPDLDAALLYLKDALKDGPVPSSTLRDEVVRQRGLSGSTYMRARKLLRLEHDARTGMTSLPTTSH